MLTANQTLLEKVFSSLSRLFGFRFPEETSTTPDVTTLTSLYAGSMIENGNFIHRHIINRMTPYIKLDESNLESIRSKISQGTLIYISIDLGQLEYNVFNAIYLAHGLPLAQFNNRLRTRRWFPLKKIKESYKQRIRFLAKYGELPHPILSGYFKKLVLDEKSVLLSIDAVDPTYLSTPFRDQLNVLLEAQKASQKPIYIVPQQLIWDKRPKREKASLFEALFGENENPGKWRKLILFFRHYKKRAIVRLGEPIPLKDFCQLTQTDTPLRLYQKILNSLEIEKRSLVGPPLRPRSWFLERIFEDENLARTIYEVAKEREKPLQSVKRLTHRYAKEIAADLHYSYFEASAIVLDWFFKNFFEGIILDQEGLKNLKKAVSLGTTILVPNHRSHIDYMLMGYLCYQNDIVSPYVAAGINLAFWPIGFYFRRCGAFFMRRSFAGNKLYKHVFQTYLKILIREGYLQEFFIEGGRSRTGKLRSPKVGMLSMYSQAMAEGAAQDIHFMPVSITYDRVLEQKSYLEEEGGKPKPKEKIRDLLKLRKFLKGRYGKIYVNFDEPISWQQVAAEIPETEWENKKPKIAEFLSQRICHAINRQVVVIPQALAASALLLSPRHGVALVDVETAYKELLRYLQWKLVKLSDTLLNNPEGSFAEAIHQFEEAGLIKRHQGLDQVFFEIPTEKRLELDFFKNISIHYFVSLSLWSTLLLARKTNHFAMQDLVEEFIYFQQLFHYEFRFSTRRSLTEHLDKLCCYLQEGKLIEYSKGKIEILKETRPSLKHFATLLKNYIEAYAVAWKTYLLRPIYSLARGRSPTLAKVMGSVLTLHPDNPRPNEEKALTKAMLTFGKRQLMLGKIEYPEAISQSIFLNAIQSFKTLGLFEAESEAAKKLESELQKLVDIS